MEGLPAGVLIDPASELTEDDLARILRRLYAMRHIGADPSLVEHGPAATARVSVPVTAKS